MLTNRTNEVKNDIRNVATDAANSPEVANMKQDARDIRDTAKASYNDMKDNAQSLASRIRADGSEIASRVGHQIEEIGAEKYAYLRDETTRQLDRIEAKVHAKPLQSIGIAFAAGFVLAMLSGRSNRY